MSLRGNCKFGGYHDMKILHENPAQKIEICVICNRKFKYNKGYKSRVDNQKYLKDHVRSFCQEFGATKRIFNKIYHPEKTLININLK